ncbi:T9SS type A sorting domain-containing protein [Flavihumibacter rivuli]|uniref:T9SS type A sorting domain-containing protein n=1 Tax=Flavihumibacter rivuli TaxID=2838156 RepID=UPI001BDECB7B|nr:T9SS type A sorting domain-containing protein [Flavihumibacter rivuli]ULQ57305.1 T9SS type A sorting domain-containing protein [Flavihumibacter rivuli]
MKNLIFLFLTIALGLTNARGQITTPRRYANFGVDGEVIANLFSPPLSTSPLDDWFKNNNRAGINVIDTTGATSITNMYATSPAFRQLPFFRVMSVPPYTVNLNKLLIDAVFIRDYHGDDSTAFTLSNKNAMSPQLWNGAIAKGIPDKNDILDIFVHVRRDGSTAIDSMYFFGGLAIDGTNGNKYFDFELYQTDIFYNRATAKFTGWGPNAGHTAWQFDAAGNITAIGDVIFSAEYGGSGLSDLKAYIWINKASLSLTPQNFVWGGPFEGDGAGATFGYAQILPKQAGPFYTGLVNTAPTWAGSFQLVRANNTVQTNFDASQFLEFSVNMTKIGLDPYTLLGGNACGLPFRRILVKTRASSSFTAELKDFIGPFDFFDFESVEAAADIPLLCGNSVSTISVINPLPTSVYTWATPNGRIISDTNGFSIVVDTPGTYIVRQELFNGCGTYAADTVVIFKDSTCAILPDNKMDLRGVINGDNARLSWIVGYNEQVASYVVERSSDGRSFSQVGEMPSNGQIGSAGYNLEDFLGNVSGSKVYYRIKIVRKDGSVRYSTVIALDLKLDGKVPFLIAPNPIKDNMQLVIPSNSRQQATVNIYDAAGALMSSRKVQLERGNNIFQFNGFERWSNGVYTVRLQVGDQVHTEKMILTR